MAAECVVHESCQWRALAYTLGTLLTRTREEPCEDDVRRRDRVLGLVVHELKTPVAIIKAYAEVLEAQAAARKTTTGSRNVMAHILEQADFMADWVDAMLDVQRVQLGELPLELTRVDLVQLAWSVALDFQRTTRRHQFRVVPAGRLPPPIVADRARLRQVLANLVENAVKYTASGTIQIRLGVQEGSGGTTQAVVAVHDDGQGLEVAQLDRIFSPFEQVERRGIGLGLGLYLARQIARLHGGELWAESHGRANGTTFVLTLPVNT